MNLGRRGFFRALAALPVVAKEAATKMGLEGALAGTIATGGPAGIPTPQDEGNWLRKAINRFHTRKGEQERRESVKGWSGRRLDPDLASMRSISPAAAYAIQVERTLRRETSQSWDNLQERAAEHAAKSLGLN